jgi:hypothetical protein
MNEFAVEGHEQFTLPVSTRLTRKIFRKQVVAIVTVKLCQGCLPFVVTITMLYFTEKTWGGGRSGVFSNSARNSQIKNFHRVQYETFLFTIFFLSGTISEKKDGAHKHTGGRTGF